MFREQLGPTGPPLCHCVVTNSVEREGERVQ